MPPSNIIRAMQPLRSCIPASFLQSTRLGNIVSRAASTTAPVAKHQQTAPELTPSPTYPYTLKTGTVVSVGRMDRTVRVSHSRTTWDPYLRKTYPKITHYLVADPRNSLREGDVIEFSSGFPKSRNVRHVVERIVAPFGSAIEDRPPVMTREERDAVRAEKRAAKWQRREARRSEGGEVQGVKEHIGRIRALIYERVGELSA
ncbi:uS17 family ribosomal protein [Aspergillus novofumigatus IBT 16806]|uniref:Nucleic acid-binding protein n=1 Tax=Aspergillus novofumigatus (strain IBT 16806) TaxID=1392255 RepID=A0A2I1CBQ5_ASPN1|nr:nucleic acid-binding protein [Aspergillus novofumigatus IBT 16806]PKX95021.1 nucleic acid-binding protein [Aspergillus novofumigatus IBT 16806]